MVKVILFGYLADTAARREITFDLSEDKTLKTLSDVMRRVDIGYLKGYGGSYLVALNMESAARETLLKDGDEVAFMPPFAGG